MEYKDLAVYVGSKVACDNCKREFTPGEIISVDEEKDLVFCYSDIEGGCAIPYCFSSRIVIVWQEMRFRDVTLPPDEQTSNYPQMPIVPESVHNLLKSVLKKFKK